MKSLILSSILIDVAIRWYLRLVSPRVVREGMHFMHYCFYSGEGGCGGLGGILSLEVRKNKTSAPLGLKQLRWQNKEWTIPTPFPPHHLFPPKQLISQWVGWGSKDVYADDLHIFIKSSNPHLLLENDSHYQHRLLSFNYRGLLTMMVACTPSIPK